MTQPVPSQSEISNQIRKILNLRKDRQIDLQYFYGKEGYIKINIEGKWLLYHEAQQAAPYLNL